jgi:hypothetical protein
MAELTPAEQNLLNFLDKLATSPYRGKYSEAVTRGKVVFCLPISPRISV